MCKNMKSLKKTPIKRKGKDTMNCKKIIIMILSLLLVYSLSFSVYVTADETKIGISSSPIKIENALRGMIYYKTLTIHNGNNNQTLVQLESKGETEGWITFCDYTNQSITFNEIIVPKERTKKIIIKITVPEQVANDTYSGTIFVNNKNETKPQNESATVALKYPLPVEINVTDDQHLDLTINTLYIRENEVEYPIILVSDVRNTGNVIAEPTITFTVIKNNIIAETLSKTLKIEPLMPEHIEISWNTNGMVPGEYRANITIALGDRTIISKNIEFNVLKVGTLKRKGILTNISTIGLKKVGEEMGIIAKFYNAGEIELKHVTFIGNIYLNDKLIDIIESIERPVFTRKEQNFYINYIIPSNGSYLIEGYFQYDNVSTYEETNKTQIAFTIGPNSTHSLFSFASIQITGVIIGVMVCIFCILQRKNLTKIPSKLTRIFPKNRKQNDNSELWQPIKNGESIEGVFLNIYKSNNHEPIIVIKEPKDELLKKNRNPSGETNIPGWPGLIERFSNIERQTLIKIVYSGEYQSTSGRLIKQFEFYKRRDDI